MTQTEHASAVLSDGEAPVLVVDLDGTLIRTDMLYETFWTALSTRWTNVVPVARAAMDGRAGVKRRLTALAAVDPGALPYNAAVVERVERWRVEGGRTALVSASDQNVVDAVARHMGIFDEAHGSDGTTNLKGADKARFLEDRFGRGNFTYAGDSDADLAVWERAGGALTVDLGPALRGKVDGLGVRSEHLATAGSRPRALLKAIRPHQWLKNILIFLPLIASHDFGVVTILQAVAAFVAFSLIASSVYLLNDLLDLASDRAHPRKRNRPFASGTLPLAWGTVAIPALLLVGIVLALMLSVEFLGVMVLYYVVTTAYSFNLKRRLIVDILTLAGLYTIRIIAGAVATGIPLSVWLLAFSIFFFLSLAAMKRQAELVSSAATGQTKAHGRGYRTDDLSLVSNMAVSAGHVSVLVMALYLNSPAVRELYATTAPLWGICLVLLYWLSRMVMITHRGWMHDDPVVFAARDRLSQICAVLIFAFAVAGVVV